MYKKGGKVYENKHGTVYVETIYGSFVDIKEDGMSQQKNAMSSRELKRAGYILKAK